MAKRKPVVGETLYSLNIGNARSKYNEAKLTPVLVTKVGRKFFECVPEGWSSANKKVYYLENWAHNNSGYSPTSQLYENPQEWEDEMEKERLHTECAKYFTYYWDNRLTLDKLRAIKRIIDGDNNAE